MFNNNIGSLNTYIYIYTYYIVINGELYNRKQLVILCFQMLVSLCLYIFESSSMHKYIPITYYYCYYKI